MTRVFLGNERELTSPSLLASRLADRARVHPEGLRRPREPPVLRRAPHRALRHRGHLPQARGPEPHRRAQDQQRRRPGAARQEDGQEAHHRRDGRGPARRRHRDGVRALRPGVHHLHGRRGHGAPEAERVPHAPARRHRHARARGHGDAQGCHLRGDPRLGHERRDDALHPGLRRGPASLPHDGARLPRVHRARDARAGDGEVGRETRHPRRVRGGGSNAWACSTSSWTTRT